MYEWRHMNEAERHEVLTRRRALGRAWHSPPHHNSDHSDVYLFTAACFEHRPLIGFSNHRIARFEDSLLDMVQARSHSVLGWVVLPNHYHFIARTSSALAMIHALGRLHARTATSWNREEARPGRQVWCRCAETAMKSNRHVWATLHYLFHNPIKHGYVSSWAEWPYSSVHSWLATRGEEEVEWLQSQFPIDQYGRGWDD
jgi:putative transposase